MTPTRISVIAVLLCVFCLASVLFGQTESATVSGRVTDTDGAVVAGTSIELTSVERGTVQKAKSNDAGIYVFIGVQPGQYHITVLKPGFRQIELSGLTLNVQDHVEKNFRLQIGSTSESITVSGATGLVNTEDASVSTVVDRNFAENLPLNGRSFQTLIQLTPGVVVTTSTNVENGQFSVNGQRTASNYWTVDGVSANAGISTTNQTGNGLSGAQPSLSVTGGTNGLVSVDAMQEFRIQTSTYAPEFGRTPGGQISIATRSGENQFHGTLFEYLRNDVLDANDWFANHTNQAKPKERQNDFGGTFSGPFLKDHSFFFLSYEGLRLRLPQVVLTTVPDLLARQQAIPAIQPFLNLYPLPNGPDNPVTGIAQFNSSFSNSATLNAYSLRLDQRLGQKLTLFGRYAYSPSALDQRGASARLVSAVAAGENTPHTATVGLTWLVSSSKVDDLRVNYTRATASTFSSLDTFGGAIPPARLPLPNGFTGRNAGFQFFILGLSPIGPSIGLQGDNLQRQVNLVDSFSIQSGSHGIKFGVDYRRLSPVYGNPAYDYEALFSNLTAAKAGIPRLSFVSATNKATIQLNNLGAFAQDTWRIASRLTMTYGIRWDLDVAPATTPSLAAVTGFNQNDLSNLALAPAGTPPFGTTYLNFAPRIGLSYQISKNHDRPAVVRGGFGIFYDLASAELGNLLYYFYYPFGGNKVVPGGTFPLSASDATPPSIASGLTSGAGLFAFDPNLKLPFTYQWNVALEQAFGGSQTVSMSYVGSAGHRQVRAIDMIAPNTNFAEARIVTNAGSSNYNALQLQVQRRLSRGFQALASYTWSHSIDDASAGDLFSSGLLSSAINMNRASSDFDIRNSLSAGLTYQIPTPNLGYFPKLLTRAWSLQTFFTSRTAPPVTVTDGFTSVRNNATQPRADLVPGQPLYLYGSASPGGKAFNPAAFTAPPVDPVTGNFLRQGTSPRNLLRAFGATQWDLAVHREFPLYESVVLQFRAEMFNVINHANFAPPISDIGQGSQFGRSVQTLGNYLTGGNVGRGGLSSLYQIGGPRSVQFALKILF